MRIYKNGKSKLQNSLKLLKNHLNCFKYNIYCFHIFSKHFREYLRVENLDYKNENIERKYFLRENSLLELENDFTELEDREEKIKIEIEELFFKPIIVSKDDLDKFEEQKMKKIRPIKRNWFDPLIKQNVMGKKPKIIRDKLKDKIINDIWTLFETEDEK